RGDMGVEAMLNRAKRGDEGAFAPRPGDSMRWLRCEDCSAKISVVGPGGKSFILVYSTPDRAMTHDDPRRRWAVKRAYPVEQNGDNLVGFQLDDSGAKLFSELTGSSIGKQIAVVLDDVVLSTPSVTSPIN